MADAFTLGVATCLPSLWLSFDSETLCRMWVVCSLISFPFFRVIRFPPSQKIATSDSNKTLNQCMENQPVDLRDSSQTTTSTSKLQISQSQVGRDWKTCSPKSIPIFTNVLTVANLKRRVLTLEEFPLSKNITVTLVTYVVQGLSFIEWIIHGVSNTLSHFNFSFLLLAFSERNNHYKYVKLAKVYDLKAQLSHIYHSLFNGLARSLSTSPECNSSLLQVTLWKSLSSLDISTHRWHFATQNNEERKITLLEMTNLICEPSLLVGS